ncbi:MAG: hypothetical protein FWD26_05955 [Treponema sp.]|nr:hypothetical protein [Treponema sp.]
MKKLFLYIILVVLVFSCASSDNVNTSQTVTIHSAQGISIRVENPTCYNVYFDEKQRIGKYSNGTVELFTESGILSREFDIWYEIPLSSNVPLYVKGDHRTIRENQNTITINEPQFRENYGIYLAIKNNAGSAITFRTGGTINPLIEQRGTPSSENFLVASSKREFSPGETAVFDISRDSGRENYYIHDSRRDITFTLPLPLKRNYLYSFEYTANTVTLTDIRPLHRAGEPAWAKTIQDTSSPMNVVSEDRQIHLFYQTDQGVNRNTYNSAGTEIASKIRNGDGFNLTYADKIDGGYLIAGFNELSNGSFLPIARIHGDDGVLRGTLDPSNNRNARSAKFNTAAKKDASNWFFAGGGAENSAAGDLAYIRAVRFANSRFTAVWELTGSDFETRAPGAKYGEIRAASYYPLRDSLLVAGFTDAPVLTSYVAEINNAGRIQNINATFRDLLFFKIITDKDGSYYLIGEEFKGEEVFAFAAKYDSGNRQLWRLVNQPASNSYYQDAILDSENGRIILAGTMRARETHGRNGTPFIDAINIADGSLIWREELTDSSLRGGNIAQASLVTAITNAPDYGFAITLSGVSDWYDRPFIIARLNSQGKFIKE